jgi:hypothetical protein
MMGRSAANGLTHALHCCCSTGHRHIRESLPSRQTQAVSWFAEDNNLALGMEEARDEIGSYYILGYYSTNTKTDGKYRSLNVKLNGPGLRSAKLDYKQGYFANPEPVI